MAMPRAPGEVGPRADAIEAEVAARLAPSPELLARLAGTRSALLAKVTAVARERGSPLVRAIVAGSAARGTFLADRLDIDLFLLFPPDLPDDRLREEGLALGRAVLSSPFVRYAEHPYLRGTFDGFHVDAVPGFAIADPAHPRSPVDRTPFHQAYLAERETPEVVGQVRLAKQFLRTLGVYGAEARTEGFSGYLVELLVLRHGTLRQLLAGARGWRIPVRLDGPDHDPPRLPPDVALILADPVDPNRNVASALSRRNLGTLIVAAREYLEAPDRAWFEPRPPAPFHQSDALARARQRASSVAVVRLARPELVDDTLYPQLRKAERAIVEELDRAGFAVLGSSSAADPDGLVVAVELAYRDRPLVRVHGGPPPGLDRAGDFLASWPAGGADVLQGPYVRADGSLGVEARRAVTSALAFLAERLPHLSLGKNLSGSSGASVADLEQAAPSEALDDALRALLAKGLPWPAPPPRP